MPDGRPYAHAWVEDLARQACLFAGILDGDRHHFAAPADEYATEFQVQQCVKYSWSEAYGLNHETGHYGPWLEDYRKLCRNGGEDD